MVTNRNRSRSSRRGNAWESALLATSLIGGAVVQAAAGRHGMAAWPAWLGMFPLFVAIRVLPPGRAALAGALWGGAGAVFHAALGEPVGSVIAAMTWVAIPSAFALAGALLTRWIGFSPLVVASLWLLLELSFPMRATVADGLSLVVWIPGAEHLVVVFGSAFVGMLMAFVCANLVGVAEIWARAKALSLSRGSGSGEARFIIAPRGHFPCSIPHGQPPSRGPPPRLLSPTVGRRPDRVMNGIVAV